MSTPKSTNHHITTLSIEESISLWVDEADSLNTEQLDSPYGRQLWESYHLIGDVLRDESLAIKPSDLFYARVAKAIDDEALEAQQVAQSQLPGRLSQMWQRWALPASGIAAALLLTLWYVQPDSVNEGAAVVATADEVWFDYLDAHRSLAGASPASYALYSTAQGN